MPTGHRTLLALLGLAPLLAACAHHVALSAADRAGLGQQPVIHVLHYETALPAVKAAHDDPPAPRAAEVRRAAGADPAALVATGFSQLAGKKRQLANLHREPSPLPRPVARTGAELDSRYHRGLALELWIDNWTFEKVAGAPGQLAMRWDGHARLSNPESGRVLWLTDECRIAGAQNRDYRIAARDLTASAKLRKMLAAARNDCARQLLRDLDRTAPTPATERGGGSPP